MSHFTVAAILPIGLEPTDEESVMAFLDGIMADYDENQEVAEYEQECYCVQHNARTWVHDQMTQKFDIHWEDAKTGERIEWDDIPKMPLSFGMGTPEFDRKRYKLVGGLETFRESFKEVQDAINVKPEYEGVPNQYDFDFEWPARNSLEYPALMEKYEAKLDEVEDAWKEHMAPYTDAETAFRLQYEADFGPQPDPNCGFYDQDALEHFQFNYFVEQDGDTYTVAQHKTQDWRNDSLPFSFKLGDKKLNEDGSEDRHSYCYGSGKTLSSYNPKSKWDWWSVGGRWDGALAGLEEIDDGEGGFNFGEQFHTFGRNSRRLADTTPDFSPYAYLTPDGVWHGKGEMGWWGMSSGDADRKEWAEEWTNVRAQYGENFAVLLDCHI